MTTTDGTDEPELKTEDEALSVLMDADIDKVMSGLDRIVEAAPSYQKLFMRWQRQQWSTEDFDFTEDARQWADPDDDHRGGAQVPAVRLLAVLPRRGAGHGRAAAVRPRRALARGAGVPDDPDLRRGQAHGLLRPLLPRGARDDRVATIGEMLDQQRSNVNEDWETLFDGILHDCAERLRKDPSDFAALVRGITVYMIVIEGTLALTGRAVHHPQPQGARLVPRLHRRLHGGQPRRVAARRIRRQVPRRRDQGRPGEREDRRGRRCKETLPVASLVFVPAVGGRPLRLPDALLPLVGDLRVRAQGAVEEAGGDGPRPGDADRGRRRLSARRRGHQAGHAPGARRPAPASGSSRRASRC